MNKGDFYKKINDLYDKGTYLEKYGLQVQKNILLWVHESNKIFKSLYKILTNFTSF